jgi:hypothetical protein
VGSSKSRQILILRYILTVWLVLFKAYAIDSFPVFLLSVVCLSTILFLWKTTN